MKGAVTNTPRMRRPGLLAGGVTVAVLAAFALMVGGTAIWADATQRDGNGYVSTHSHRYASSTRAIATDSVTVGTEVPHWLFGKVRVEATSKKPVFLGIARKSDVDAYLARTAYASATDLDLDPFRVTYVRHPGSGSPMLPTKARFWAASATGSGTQALTWKVRSGEWSIVAMNADGSPGVSVDVSVGAKFPWVLWAGIGLAALGILLAALAARMIYGGSGPKPLREARPAGGALKPV
jgi:hypothetical protein